MSRRLIGDTWERAGFFDKQQEATESADSHQFFLYGGSRGPGKSYWLRWYLLLELLRLNAEGIRGAVVGLFCEDYPMLKDRQISKISSEFPRDLGELRASQDYGLGFHLLPEYGGGVLALRNLDDPSKYQSAEFAGIGIDELTKNILDKFNLLRGSLRWPGVPRPRFVATANPGGKGHQWVKGYWLDGVFPPEITAKALDREFGFVKALPGDNPYLTKDYWEMLETLPPDLAKAWRWGEWDVFAGLFFGTFRTSDRDERKSHVIPCFDVPAEWQLYGSVDYGFNARTLDEKPFIYQLYAVSHEGHEYMVDELAAAEWPISKQIEEIKRLESRYPQPVRSRLGCPSMFTSKEHRGPTIAEDYGKEGLKVKRADTDHIGGWARCRAALEDAPDGLPWFMVFDRCTEFVKRVTSVVFDEKHPEDIDPDSVDHPLEAWRHYEMSRPRKPKLIEEPKIIPPRQMPADDEEYVDNGQFDDYQL